MSAAAKVLFKSILAMRNIQRPYSATCLAFHHSHLTVAHSLSLYFLQECPLQKRENKKQCSRVKGVKHIGTILA